MRTFLFLYLLFYGFTALSGTVAGTGGSTEVTQIANNMQLVNQYSELISQGRQLADQLRRQAEMVSDMQKQGKSLSNLQWGQAQTDLQKLSTVVIDGQALAYSLTNLDQKYKDTYKGYSAYAAEQSQGQDSLSARYENWSRTNLDTIRSSMNSAHLQQSQFATEDQTLRTIQQMGNTAEGRMQAIQTGNQIASMQVGQLQKLRALMMSQMQMQASYMANESAKEDMKAAESRKFFERKGDGPKVGNGMGF